MDWHAPAALGALHLVIPGLVFVKDAAGIGDICGRGRGAARQIGGHGKGAKAGKFANSLDTHGSANTACDCSVSLSLIDRIKN